MPSLIGSSTLPGPRACPNQHHRVRVGRRLLAGARSPVHPEDQQDERLFGDLGWILGWRVVRRVVVRRLAATGRYGPPRRLPGPSTVLPYRGYGGLLRLVTIGTGGPHLPCFGRVMARFGTAAFPADPGIGPGGQKQSQQGRNDQQSPPAVPRTQLPAALRTSPRVWFAHASSSSPATSHPSHLLVLRDGKGKGSNHRLPCGEDAPRTSQLQSVFARRTSWNLLSTHSGE